MRDWRATYVFFNWKHGNIFSVSFLSFCRWCLFQSLPSSTSSSILGREPSRRSTSRWVWRLSRRWRSSWQMKWSTPEPAFRTLWITEKLLVLSRVGSGKRENKKQPKTTLLVVLEPKTKTDSQGNYNPTSNEILGETLSLKGASVHHRSSQLHVSSNHRSNSETVNCRTWTLEMLKLSSGFICHDSQGRPTRPYPGENWSSLLFWVFCPSFQGGSIRFFILTWNFHFLHPFFRMWIQPTHKQNWGASKNPGITNCTSRMVRPLSMDSRRSRFNLSSCGLADK